jgi:type I restriction enzyme S subunit
MFYYLSQQKIFNYLRDSQSSSTMPAISFNIMNNLQINLPNIEYQSKIVKILDCLNNKIVINNKINNNLSYVT